MAVFKEAQKLVGLAEGGYQADPRDTGNYYKGQLIGTNWGISAPVLAKYLGRTPSVEDMKRLTRATAEEILKINYWLKNNFDKLKNQSIANLLYDGAVNHGSNGMRFLVEKGLRVMKKPMSYYKVFTVGGIEYLNSLNQRKLFESIKNARKLKYQASKQKHFIKGWLRRLNRIIFKGSSAEKSYTKAEIENMQAWLLETAGTECNHRIIDLIMTTGGIDGIIGKGFRGALDEAISHGYVKDLVDLFSKSN